MVKRLLIAYFIGNISAKNMTSVHVCQSYSKPNVGRFWGSVVILLPYCCLIWGWLKCRMWKWPTKLQDVKMH